MGKIGKDFEPFLYNLWNYSYKLMGAAQVADNASVRTHSLEYEQAYELIVNPGSQAYLEVSIP